MPKRNKCQVVCAMIFTGGKKNVDKLNLLVYFSSQAHVWSHWLWLTAKISSIWHHFLWVHLRRFERITSLFANTNLCRRIWTWRFVSDLFGCCRNCQKVENHLDPCGNEHLEKLGCLLDFRANCFNKALYYGTCNYMYILKVSDVFQFDTGF